MVTQPSRSGNSPRAVGSGTQPARSEASPDSLPACELHHGGRDVLATRTAAIIEQEILSRGLLVGAFVGSEHQLATRLGVGRATLRSAVRQLEMLGLAKVRSGRGGGVFVTGSLGDAAANRLSGWLMTLRLRFTDVAWASWMLLQYASGRAARLLNDGSVDRIVEACTDTYNCANKLSAYIERRTKLRQAIVEAADNPALLILFKALDRTWRETLLPYDGSPESEEEGVAAARHGDQKLVEAILSRSEARARETAWNVAQVEMERIGIRVALGNLPDEVVPKTAFVATRFGGQTLSAMALRALHGDIRRLPPGARPYLGTLAELAVRYGVSVDVMREAAALGERNGLITVRRGRNGGIRVREIAESKLGKPPAVLSDDLRKKLNLSDGNLAEIDEVLAFGLSALEGDEQASSKAAMIDILAALADNLVASPDGTAALPSPSQPAS